jgi:hypothetical protein
MSVFAKAKAKAVANPTPKKKATTWTVSGAPGTPEAALAAAVKELGDLEAKAKAIETAQGRLKAMLLKYAEEQFVKDYVRAEKVPDSPMLIANAEGESVNFVFQDRSGQYGVTEEAEKDLVKLLGEDNVNEILYDETRFAFNRVIMGIPGVMDTLGKHLEACQAELKEKKILSAEQVEELLEVKNKRTVRPGVLDRLTQVCGRDTTRVRDFISYIGSCAVRYIKA